MESKIEKKIKGEKKNKRESKFTLCGLNTGYISDYDE